MARKNLFIFNIIPLLFFPISFSACGQKSISTIPSSVALTNSSSKSYANERFVKREATDRLLPGKTLYVKTTEVIAFTTAKETAERLAITLLPQGWPVTILAQSASAASYVMVSWHPTANSSVQWIGWVRQDALSSIRQLHPAAQHPCATGQAWNAKTKSCVAGCRTDQDCEAQMQICFPDDAPYPDATAEYPAERPQFCGPPEEENSEPNGGTVLICLRNTAAALQGARQW
jgi:hypothetical protein